MRVGLSARSDPGPVDRLLFESSSPRSVAALVGRRPGHASCEVRGRLFVAGSPARLECKVDWGTTTGRCPDLQMVA